jgi:hypothetical protein
MNRTFSLCAALALSIGVFAGCTDSTVQSTPSDDAFAMYSVDQAAIADFSEIPPADQILAREGDPITRGESSDTRGFGRFELRSYERILRQLQLSERQVAAIRVCFTEYRECATSSATRYRNARGEMSDALKNGIARVRAAVEGGSMTRQEAGEAIARLTRTYRQDVTALNDAFKSAVDACKASLDSCIESHLTEEQLVRWNRLKR